MPTHADTAGAAVHWIPVLLIPGPDLEEGLSQSFYERQSGSYATAAEAMHVAVALLKTRPDAIGATVRRQGGAA